MSEQISLPEELDLSVAVAQSRDADAGSQRDIALTGDLDNRDRMVG